MIAKLPLRLGGMGLTRIADVSQNAYRAAKAGLPFRQADLTGAHSAQTLHTLMHDDTLFTDENRKNEVRHRLSCYDRGGGDVNTTAAYVLECPTMNADAFRSMR